MSETALQAMDKLPAIAQERGTVDDLGFLWDFWYPAMRGEGIYRSHLATAMLLEVPLVIGRTSEG